MSRDRTHTRETAADATGEFDAEFEPDDRTRTEEAGSADSDRSLRGRAAERGKELFSPRHFFAALLLIGASLFAAGTFIPLPGAGLVGVFLAAFAFGLVASKRRYAETAVAGGIATAASTFLDFAVVAFFGGFGVSLAAVAGGLGAVIAAVGAYFGRDLRDGLTRDL